MKTSDATRRIIEAWRTDYSTVRPHSSLGGMASAEFTNRPSHGYEETEANLSAAYKRGAGHFTRMNVRPKLAGRKVGANDRCLVSHAA